MVIRLALDLNVLVADRLARKIGRKGTAASMLVEATIAGACPAGPVQLVISVPVIENWSDVLRRHFGYPPEAASEMAWLLRSYAIDGPLGLTPQIVVGSGFVPFETEAEMLASLRAHAADEETNKLFDEVSDDRHVLLAALAGRAHLLATANLRDFSRGPAVRFIRDDVVLFPWADRELVVARPAFIAHWLRQGVVPDADFIRAHREQFVPL